MRALRLSDNDMAFKKNKFYNSSFKATYNVLFSDSYLLSLLVCNIVLVMFFVFGSASKHESYRYGGVVEALPADVQLSHKPYMVEELHSHARTDEHGCAFDGVEFVAHHIVASHT